MIDGLSIKQLFDGAGGTVVGRSRKVTDVQRRKLHVIRALIDIIRQYADLYKQQTVSYYAVFGYVQGEESYASLHIHNSYIFYNYMYFDWYTF